MHSSAILVDSAMIWCPTFSRHCRRSATAAYAHVTACGVRTCTRVSATLRIAASRAAQTTATFEAGDPSTPTSILELIAGRDISLVSGSSITALAGDRRVSG